MSVRKRFRKKSGFSLTEMIAVLAIIAILAAVVITVGRYAVKRARMGKATATLTKLSLAIELYKQDFGMYPPESVKTENGDSLANVLARLNWPQGYADARGRKRPSQPSLQNYDKPSEILFFFLEEMYDVMNFNPASRDRNSPLLGLLPRKTAYVKFKRKELADTDGDELPEIIDGWGMPFLYVAADRMRGDTVVNIEPHQDKNPSSFSLYSFGPDKLGYYDATRRGERDYPVGDLDFDGQSNSADDSEMTRRITSSGKTTAVANKDNVTNWERER